MKMKMEMKGRSGDVYIVEHGSVCYCIAVWEKRTGIGNGDWNGNALDTWDDFRYLFCEIWDGSKTAHGSFCKHLFDVVYHNIYSDHKFIPYEYHTIFSVNVN